MKWHFCNFIRKLEVCAFTSPSHSNSSIAFEHRAGSVDTRYLTPIGGRSEDQKIRRSDLGTNSGKYCWIQKLFTFLFQTARRRFPKESGINQTLQKQKFLPQGKMTKNRAWNILAKRENGKFERTPPKPSKAIIKKIHNLRLKTDVNVIASNKN